MRIRDWSSDVCASDRPGCNCDKKVGGVAGIVCRQGDADGDRAYQHGGEHQSLAPATSRGGGFGGIAVVTAVAVILPDEGQRRGKRIARGQEDRKSTRLNSSH